jgi:hypothetical protein
LVNQCTVGSDVGAIVWLAVDISNGNGDRIGDVGPTQIAARHRVAERLDGTERVAPLDGDGLRNRLAGGGGWVYGTARA